MKLKTFAYLTSLALVFACNTKLIASTEIKSLENISQELVDIRQKIASLHDAINYEKDSFNDQLRSYSNQKADLNVKVSRADLNIKELQRELEKLQAENEEKFSSYDEVSPLLNTVIKSVKASLEDSVPFKREQRLQALNDIAHRLNTNIITPNKAANQLWAFVEDELILGRTSGIYNETITVAGEEKLVKVLRLGKVAMFYKTSDEKYGLIRRSQGEWKQLPLEDQADQLELDNLFDSFNKNIRNGLFAVPNFLPEN